MTWTKTSILRELKKFHKAHADLSYNAMAQRQQSLVSAAAYHFGSYRKAIDRAGIFYDDVSRRPRWTKQSIIASIKKARRDGRDLNWSSVTKKRDELSKAAFASLQPRLFGQWARALHAAGLDSDDVSLYRTWDRNTIVFDLRERKRDGESLSSGELQREVPALHAAAIRHFPTYADALRAAGVDAKTVRRRRLMDRASVLAHLKRLGKKGSNEAYVKRTDASLHRAAIREFGSFNKRAMK